MPRPPATATAAAKERDAAAAKEPAAAEKGGEQGERLVDRLVTQRTLGATVCVAQYDACGLGANDLVTLDHVLAIPIDEVDVDVRWPVVAEERAAVPEPYQPRSPGAPCT
jgi:hypothetical protein